MSKRNRMRRDGMSKAQGFKDAREAAYATAGIQLTELEKLKDTARYAHIDVAYEAYESAYEAFESAYEVYKSAEAAFLVELRKKKEGRNGDDTGSQS